MNEASGIIQQKQPLPHEQHQSLSAQQMQALAKNHADHLSAIKRDVELRKWAVDQACGLCGSYLESDATPPVAIELAREIHAFLVEGAEKEKAE